MAENNLHESDATDYDLNLYFNQSQLDGMSLIDKLVTLNKMKNYFICNSLNLYCEIPEFMKKSSDTEGIEQDVESITKTQLSRDAKKSLFCSEIPLSCYTADSKQIKIGFENCLELPLCKNKESMEQIWDNLCSIAPTIINEIEDNCDMKRRALKQFKDHNIELNELLLMFSASIEQMEKAVDRLSVDAEQIKKPKYALRKHPKIDSSPVDKLKKYTKKFLSNKSISNHKEASESIKSVTRVDWYLPKSFAAKTLPDGLTLKPSELSSASVFTTQQVKKGTIFGPYVGVRMYDDDVAKVSGRVWEIFVGGLLHHYVDGDDPEQSNWMRYINHATSPQLQNLESFQFHYKIYYKTTTDIPSDTELLVWYSENYNQDDDSLKKDETIMALTATKNEPIAKLPKSNEIKTSSDDARKSKKDDDDDDDDVRIVKKKKSDKVHDIILKNKTFDCNNDASEPILTSKQLNAPNVDRKHKCSRCEKSFMNEYRLKRHRKTHITEGENKIYKCDQCDSTFVKKSSLQNHMRFKIHRKTHTTEGENKIYKCDQCDSTFVKKLSLQKHMRFKIHKNQQIDIEKRQMTQLSEVEKINKTDNKHSPIVTTRKSDSQRDKKYEKQFECDLCGTECPTGSKLKYHIRAHSSIKPYKCYLCNATFMQNNHLKSHLRSHDIKPHTCVVCGSAFRKIQQLSIHMKKRHAPAVSYKCEICGQSFGNQSVYFYHRRIHKIAKSFTCDTCGTSFKTNKSLKSHVRFHTGEKPHKCQSCGVSFKDLDLLQSHERIHRANRPTYQRGKMLMETDNFKYHMSRNVEGNFFKCKVCGYTFRKHYWFRMHLMYHAQEEPVTCDVCKVSFKARVQLKFHTLIHTDERPHTCNVCGISCKLTSHLRSHMRVHIRDEPMKSVKSEEEMINRMMRSANT